MWIVLGVLAFFLLAGVGAVVIEYRGRRVNAGTRSGTTYTRAREARRNLEGVGPSTMRSKYRP